MTVRQVPLILAALGLFGLTPSLAACNTAAGIGQDLQAAGRARSPAAPKGPRRGTRARHRRPPRARPRRPAPERRGVRLLQEGVVHPHLVVLALARVTGEVGAGTALASEQDPEELLRELAEVVRRAGREFREMLEAGALPTAGNA